MSDAPFRQWHTIAGEVSIDFFRLHSGGYLIRFPQVADFEVAADGSLVTAWPAPRTSLTSLEHLYLNQVLPLAMSRQARLALHGSAVALRGQALAFLGESGSGKSTLAAAFSPMGAKFLTDDGLHLVWKDDRCWVNPSHPSIRLWSDSHEALAPDGVETSRDPRHADKTQLVAGPCLPYCEKPQPLGRLYVLGDSVTADIQFSALTAVQGVLDLVKNTFLLDVEDQEILSWHFDEMLRLANAVPVYRLDYPRDYSMLPAICEAISKHAQNV